jgi:hypothetical protein
MPCLLTGGNIAFVFGKPFSSTELIKTIPWFSINFSMLACIFAIVPPFLNDYFMGAL